MTRVSVVVAAYNVAPYLSRCLDSLLAQTESSLEVLIVNDGSTDETPSLADRYAANDSRMKVIHQENGGLSVARNVGLSAATGTYVCFVDGDDWVEPTMAEAMASWCDSTGAEVAIAGAFVDFHDETDCLIHSQVRNLPRYCIQRSQPLPAGIVDENFINLVGYAWNKIYRREWVVSLEEWFEEELILIEDIEFNSRVLSKAEHVALMPEAFVHYIQRPRPSLGSFRDMSFLALSARAIEGVDFLLAEWGVDDNVREERKATASATGLWTGINAAARVPRRRQMLKQLVAFPGAEVLLISTSFRSADWRGAWATFTIGQGWYGIALLPVIVVGSLKDSRSFARIISVANLIRRHPHKTTISQ